jgi:hypothetical protein
MTDSKGQSRDGTGFQRRGGYPSGTKPISQLPKIPAQDRAKAKGH